MGGKACYILDIENDNLDIQLPVTDLRKLEAVMLACLKREEGLYDLLFLKEKIHILKMENGEIVKKLNLLPYIQIKIPNKLFIKFDKENNAEIRSGNGELISENEELEDFLWEYMAFAENEETIFLSSYEGEIGELHGELFSEGENIDTEEIIEEIKYAPAILGIVCEPTMSGETWEIEEFIEMNKSRD